MVDLEILIVHEPIDAATLQQLAAAWYGTMVKGVADVERGIVALGGDWHIDANNVLIADGSQQPNLWGFNIQLEKEPRVEYISLINIRPAQGNRAMELEDVRTRERILVLLKKFIPHV